MYTIRRRLLDKDTDTIRTLEILYIPRKERNGCIVAYSVRPFSAII